MPVVEVGEEAGWPPLELANKLLVVGVVGAGWPPELEKMSVEEGWRLLGLAKMPVGRVETG